jgi:hypothetical protein
MKSPVIARGSAKEASPGLSERIARFASAINGCSAQGASKPAWEQWDPAHRSTEHKALIARQGIQAG